MRRPLLHTKVTVKLRKFILTYHNTLITSVLNIVLRF